MNAVKRIGILTSGGDCAGWNVVIRAAVHRAASYRWQVVGIEEGTHGLLNRPPRELDLKREQIDGTILCRGGTILGTTNRGDSFEFLMPDGSVADLSEEVIQGYCELRLDALIGVSGDGNQSILRRLAQKGGIKRVSIPRTIDNDIGATEVSVEYGTAVHVATESGGMPDVDLIANGKFDRMVAWQNRRVIDALIDDEIADFRAVDVDGALIRKACVLGICLGA